MVIAVRQSASASWIQSPFDPILDGPYRNSDSTFIEENFVVQKL